MKHLLVKGELIKNTRCDRRLSDCPILKRARESGVEYKITTNKPAEDYTINIGTNKSDTLAFFIEYQRRINFLCNSCLLHNCCRR